MPDSYERYLKKYFFWMVLLILIILTYFIIKDFIVAIVSSFVLAFAVLPLHKMISKKIDRRISAAILLAGLIIIILGFLYLIANSLIDQATRYFTASNLDQVTEITKNFFLKFTSSENIANSIPKIVGAVFDFAIAAGLVTIKAIPNIGLTIFLTFMICYFLLLDWDEVTAYISDLMPFKEKKSLLDKLSKSFRNIVYGYLFIGMIEFIISIIGFKIAGIQFYALFAMIIGIFAFIPFLGPMAIWAPLCIFHLLLKNYYSAIVILITGLILTILVDHILVSIIVGRKARIHPVIILLGVLGGVKLFGLFGFIIGPLALNFVLDILTIHIRKNSKKVDSKKIED